MNARLILQLIVAVGLARALDAAQPYREVFASAQAAAGSGLSLGAGAWTFTGETARVTFASTQPYAIPDVATLRLSAPAFTGDYQAAGIGVMGFRFRCEQAAPSSLHLELTAGGSVFQRIIPVTSVGVWNECMVSLSGAEAGGWSAKKGDLAGFAEALKQVQSVTLKFSRSGAAARDYVVDDFYVDVLPDGAQGSLETDKIRLVWDAVQVGLPYVMQESSHPAGPWQDTTVLSATNRLLQVEVPMNAPGTLRFFRLRGP